VAIAIIAGKKAAPGLVIAERGIREDRTRTQSNFTLEYALFSRLSFSYFLGGKDKSMN